MLRVLVSESFCDLLFRRCLHREIVRTSVVVIEDNASTNLNMLLCKIGKFDVFLCSVDLEFGI